MIPKPELTQFVATPDFVKREIIPFNTYKGQRPKSDAKRKGIERAMRQGKFLYANYATCEYKGTKWVMNGQHTADAQTQTGISVQAVLAHYVFPRDASMQDVAELFMQFDATPCRTKSDKGRAVVAGVGEDMLCWPSQFRNLLIDAFSLLFDAGDALEWNVLGRRRDVDTCATHLHSNAHECRFVYQIFYNATGIQHRVPHMSHPSVVAAMMTTYQTAEANAIAFWTNVRAGEVISSDDPEYTLREHLRELQSKKWKSRGRDGVFRKIDPQAIYSACIKAWNANRKGKRINGLTSRAGSNIPSLA